MRFSIEKPFVIAVQRLVSSIQLRFRQRSNVRSKQPHRHFSVPHFDAESERLFWQERQSENLYTLKTALLLGAACFLAFIALDMLNGGLSENEIIGRLLIALTFSVLWLSLYRRPQAESQIKSVAKLSVALSVASLTGILFIEGNPAFYEQIWIGLLPMYFFTYGQMFMTIAETLKFGLLAMIALPLSGYLIGVETVALMPSIIILLIVNAFGFCTRCQLEARTRNLFQERRKAEAMSADKTLFLQHLSHNLCQPLQALSCYSSVLDAAFSDQPCEPLQQVADKLSSCIDELNATFNRIFDVANLENGRQIPKLTTVDINVLLAKLENQFAPQAARRGLKLNVRLRSRPPYTVYSDASILSQIIGNLIDNAIKYTASGWVVISVVKISDDRLKLHVCDSGIGIADELHSEIFEEFFRCRDPADTHANGLGIGLAYALKATERLPKHNLRVYSRLHYGSDFQLCLPVSCATTQGISARPQQPVFTGSFVFVVDADHQSLNVMTEQLTAWGCLVQKALSIAETLAALAENIRPPDLVITNFYLDGKDTAHDIIAAIQADYGPVPTLILTDRSIPDENKAKWPENTHLLRKPADEADLIEMMVKAMGKPT
ncbi:MAG: hybrid sensor histidine kinase/response regulator [Methylobacter sp.]|nr:MAG: hybrid sensor histidine kinase/response regulator [Methylobacter sp.]